MLFNSRMYLDLSIAFCPSSFQVDKLCSHILCVYFFGEFNAIVIQVCDLK